MFNRNTLPIVALTVSFLFFVACDAAASGACYIDDYKIVKVVDENGIEYEPQKMTLTFAFGTYERDFCGISSDAVPMEHTFRGTFGVQSTYPVFGVPEDGVEDTRTSLSGNVRDFPSVVILGAQYRGRIFR